MLQRHTYEIHPRIDKLLCWVDYDEVTDTEPGTAQPGNQASAASVQGLLGGVVPVSHAVLRMQLCSVVAARRAHWGRR